jgi:exo-beta-1,3-glucanase (GH17 family)
MKVKVILLQILFLHIFSSFVSASCPNKPFYGVCFTPYRQGQDPIDGNFPSEEQLEEDVAIISQIATATRTYGIDHNLAKVPELCNDYGIDCYVGCWISGNTAEDQSTIAQLITIANAGYATTRALIVGNEYVYHHFSDPCSVPYITGLMNQVRSATTLPVATAEPWDIWFARPSLVDAVDFLPIHHYGFLRRFGVDIAVQENIGVYNAIKNRYPGKEIIIFETGWPTQGEVLGDAVPSEENQEQFLKKFLPLAKESNIRYFIFAGFDEPYKEQRSGIVYESHWGLCYENRTVKPGLNSILSANPADIDFDGDVDTIDLGKLAIDWLEGTEASDLCLPGDLNHDETINFYDFAELADNWLFSEE